MGKADRIKILIVDDEKSHRDIIKASLVGKDVVIKELDSGLKFHETIKEFRPYLLLIDFQMPNKDGITLCQELKKYDQKIHIIFISSVLDAQIKRDLTLIGVDDCLTKPISPIMLRKKLTQWVI